MVDNSVTAMLMSAAVMALFGATQRIYRGYWWWVSAQWLAAIGLLLHGWAGSHPSLLPLAYLLCLQWPVVVLGGVRRFYPRHALRIPQTTDFLLLAIVSILWLISWSGQNSASVGGTAFSAGACLLHIYSATLTLSLHDALRSSALKILSLVQCLAGLVHGLRVAYALGYASPLFGVETLAVAGNLVTIAIALLMVYLCLQLTYERAARKLRESQRQLRYLADMDMLTEVPNRRHFYELAERVLASTAPGEASIVMFDLDHFKRINDDMGHAAGDTALRAVAACVRDTLRGQDVAGRIGGDEFALLLPETPGQDAISVADRIVTQLQMRPGTNQNVPLSLSFGVVLVQTDESIDEAMRRADKALYEAKRQGRSCAVIASGTDEDPVFSASQAMGLSTV